MTRFPARAGLLVALLFVIPVATMTSARAATTPSVLSTSHTISQWSRDRTIAMSWSFPDPAVGYSFEWSREPATIPDDIIDTVTTTATSPSLVDGAHWFHVRAQDALGNWTDTQHVGPFLIDDTAPPVVVIIAPSSRVQQANRFTVSWRGHDPMSGAATYYLRYRIPGHGYVLLRTNTTRTSIAFLGALNRTYCFSARALDRARNVGPWGADRCTKVPSDADVPSPTCGRVGARVIRFRVSVQSGLPTTRADFARGVTSILCDARSWIKAGSVRFRYDPHGSLLVALRAPAATERRCRQLTGGLSVHFYFSCGSASAHEATLNSGRWFTGSRFLSYSVRQYRRLLTNHEVGHTLGEHHRTCPRRGARAPVMMQQSKGLNGCGGNVWPLPYELRSIRH